MSVRCEFCGSTDHWAVIKESCPVWREAKALARRALASGQVIYRGPGNPLYDAEMRKWAQLGTPRSSIQTVPGRTSFSVLEKGKT